MVDNKVTKLSDERAKLEAQLQLIKDKERKAKRELARKERIKRETWLKIFGEIVLTHRNWNQDKLNTLLESAQGTVSDTNYKKLIEGLKTEGLLQEQN